MSADIFTNDKMELTVQERQNLRDENYSVIRGSDYPEAEISVLQSDKRYMQERIKIFNNPEFGTVNVFEYSGEVYFELYSVGMALGQTKEAKGRLYPRKERIDENVKNADIKPVVHNGQLWITEAQLYDLMFEVHTDKVKPFRRWVTNEVLPSIRKHGMYATDNVIDQILNNPDFGIALLTTLKKEREARREAERKNAILMHVNKTYTMTEIAKELNLRSAIQLNKLLAEKKIQYQVNGTWVMYSQYSDLGYEEIKQEVLDSGKVIYHRRITQMGRDYILNLFE